MELTPSKVPWAVKKMFPKYVWNMAKDEKAIYLTFDDGPIPEITEWVLDTLKQYDAKATFFCIGENIQKNPDIFNKIVLGGHQIGNHTNNHLNGWFTPFEEYLDNIQIAQEIISSKYQNTQNKIKLFRPPYGKLKPQQGVALIELGYKIIMWDILSIDWSQKTSNETCLKNVTNHAKCGSIVVFHDSLKAEKNLRYALPKTLEHFKNKGFEFRGIN